MVCICQMIAAAYVARRLSPAMQIFSYTVKKNQFLKFCKLPFAIGDYRSFTFRKYLF